MRILLVCENYVPHIGGVELLFKNLANGFIKRGHKVAVLTHQLKNTRKREIMDRVNIFRVPSLHSRYVFTFTSIFKAISLTRKSDIIHTTTFNGAFPAWLAARIVGKPVSITVHEVWIGKWKQITNFGWFNCFIHDILERMVYLLPFDKYICVSEATKKDLIRRGINESKVKTIYNGLDYEFWNEKKVTGHLELRKQLGLQNKLVYFSWGRPGESKGFEYLIKAVSLAKVDAVFLLMLSSIDNYQKKYNKLVRLINKYNVDVRIINSVSHEQLRVFLKMADFVIVPSTSEGFGYTTVEAVAMKKPVIVSSAGSLPEVVSGRHLIFRNKDVRDLAEKMVKMSKKEYIDIPIKKFEWDECVERYLRELKYHNL